MSSILDVSVGDESTFLEYVDGILKAYGDTYVSKQLMFETIKNHEWVFVLSTKALYKFRNTTTPSPPRKRVDLMDIHSIVPNTEDGRVFDVFTYKSKTKFEWHKMWGAIGRPMAFDSFLQHRRYECKTALECSQWVFVMSALVRNLWQCAAESTVVPAPEIYQRHACVIKVRKRGLVHASQDRLLILSSQWLYNLEVTHGPTVLSRTQLRWAIPVSSVTAINVRDEGCTLDLTVDIDNVKKSVDDDHLGSKGYNINGEYSFGMHTRSECSLFVYDLHRLCLAACGRNIVVGSNDSGAQSPR